MAGRRTVPGRWQCRAGGRTGRFLARAPAQSRGKLQIGIQTQISLGQQPLHFFALTRIRQVLRGDLHEQKPVLISL